MWKEIFFAYFFFWLGHIALVCEYSMVSKVVYENTEDNVLKNFVGQWGRPTTNTSFRIENFLFFPIATASVAMNTVLRPKWLLEKLKSLEKDVRETALKKRRGKPTSENSCWEMRVMMEEDIDPTQNLEIQCTVGDICAFKKPNCAF